MLEYKGVVMDIWFTSDNHFNHYNIIKYCGRPFHYNTEMTHTLVNNWNKCVGENDLVYHLGDFGLASKQSMADILSRLNGQIILILGNHDKGIKWMREAGFGVIIPKTGMKIILGKHVVQLSHFPYSEPVYFENKQPTHKDKFASIRPKDEGNWLIHGHIHETRRFDFERKMINVSVDVWDFKPVHANHLIDYMDNH